MGDLNLLPAEPRPAGGGSAEPGTRSGSGRGVYLHLDRACAIMRYEPDFRRWGPLIDALPPEIADEIRPWLRQQARKRICYQHYLRQHGQTERAARPALRLAV